MDKGLGRNKAILLDTKKTMCAIFERFELGKYMGESVTFKKTSGEAIFSFDSKRNLVEGDKSLLRRPVVCVEEFSGGFEVTVR